MAKFKRISGILFSFTEFWVIKAVRKGLMYSTPLILIGSLALLLLNFPIPAFRNFLTCIFTIGWRDVLLSVYYGTFQIMSLVVLLCTAYFLSIEAGLREKHEPPRLISIIVTFSCYFTIHSSNGLVIGVTESTASGLFWAMIVSVFFTLIFHWFYNHRIFKGKFIFDNSESTLNYIIAALEPALFTIIIALIAKPFINQFEQSTVSIVTEFFRKNMGLASTLLFNIITQALWFFGFHGNNIAEPVNIQVYTAASNINSSLAAAGMAPTEIFTKQFLDIFVFMGGSGSTLCLIIALLLKGKKTNSLRLARFSLLPGLCNINEPLTFGMPVVLNPYLLAPFIMTPMALTLTTYIAMKTGLVPLTTNSDVFWTTPVILGGYYATGSVSGAILQIFNVFVGVLIYTPFINIYENYRVEANKRITGRLIDALMKNEIKAKDMLKRRDDLGSLARHLSQDIETAIDDNSLNVEYQPQGDYNDKIFGCEALLRWNHKKYGCIPPPVIISLAQASGLTHKLGDWVINTAIRQAKSWMNKGMFILLSINIESDQVLKSRLNRVIKNAIDETGLDPQYLEFELTEGRLFEFNDEVADLIAAVKDLGVKIAIDDFGMGHSSLKYVKEFDIDTVKLDGQLVKDILLNPKSAEIITTICSLCKSLNLDVIAEFVETREDIEALHKLGCDKYQGYYFSPSMPPDKLFEYVIEKNEIIG